MQYTPTAGVRRLAGSAAILAALAGTPANAATLLFDPSVSSCTGINCSSITVGGTVLNSGGLTASRWDVAIFANNNECLRLDETAMSGTGADDEMVVVAPNGDVFRNDDFGGTLRPRVVIRPTPARGWYYVSIARFNGAPDPEHDIQLTFARYTNSATNQNCASPTASSAVAPAVASLGAGVASSSDSASGKPAAVTEPTNRNWPTAR